MSSPVFSVALSWQAWHETGHVFAAEALGVAVRSVRIGRPHEGGATDVGSVGPRQRLLIALGGLGAEKILSPRTLFVACSRSDLRAAYAAAFDLAAGEEQTTRPASGPRAALARSDAPVMTAPGWQRVKAAAEARAEAVLTRRTARAHEIVDAGEAEVLELLGRNRIVLRTVAAGLQERGHLDAEQVAVLVRAGRLRQIEEDERRRSA